LIFLGILCYERIALFDLAIKGYKKRFGIEEMFKDFRGNTDVLAPILELWERDRL